MKYEISELKLNLSFATSMMTHENVGEYAARLELQHQGDGLDVVEHTIACYWFGFSVDEVREQSD